MSEVDIKGVENYLGYTMKENNNDRGQIQQVTAKANAVLGRVHIGNGGKAVKRQVETEDESA